MSNYAITVKQVERSFPDFKLGPLNLEVKPGLVLGLIGPNGAGKSTLINCLAGLLRPDSGELSVFGKQVDLNKIDWKYEIGYVSDEPVFYEQWTGQKNLNFMAGYFPAWSWPYVTELSQRLQCPLDKKVKNLSRGNRVKLALISVLARRPRLLLLDEPTSGLDPVVRDEFLAHLWELLENEEQTILYATHVIADVGKIADELAFICNGRLTRRTPKEQLLEDWARISFRAGTEKIDLPDLIHYDLEGHTHQLVTSDHNSTLEALRKLQISQLEQSHLSLEEIVIAIMKGDQHV